MKLLRTLWTLARFSKETGLLDKEYELAKFDYRAWQELLGLAMDISTYGAYPIRPGHVGFVQQYVDDRIDLTKFDYFIEECGVYDEKPK